MGSSLSVDSAPVEFQDVFTLRADIRPQTERFTANLKIWKTVQRGTGVTACIQTCAVQLSDEQMDSTSCYVVALTFSHGPTELLPTSAWVNDVGASKRSLLNLSLSCVDQLSPRGLQSEFSPPESFKPPSHASNGEANGWSYSNFETMLYLWNGKDSSSLAKAAAMSKAFSLERALTCSTHLPAAMFRAGQPVPICRWFVDDSCIVRDGSVDTAPGIPQVTLLRRLQWNTNHSTSIRAKVERPLSAFVDLRSQTGIPFQRSSSTPTLLAKINPISSPAGASTAGPVADVQSPSRSASMDVDGPSGGPPIGAGPAKISPPLSLQLKLGPGAAAGATDDAPVPVRRLGGRGFGLDSGMRVPFHLNLETITATARSGELSGDNKEEKLAQFSKVASPIMPNLFVGGDIPARDKQQLLDCGVTHIANTASMVCDNYFPNDFIYVSVNLIDSPDEDISSTFPVLLHFIDQALSQGGKVYIHCYQGVSRSCSVAIAYIMWLDTLTYEEAYQNVRAARGICSPNSGFIAALLRWQRQLHSSRRHLIQLFRTTPHSIKYPVPFVLREVTHHKLPSSMPSMVASPRDEVASTPRSPQGPYSSFGILGHGGLNAATLRVLDERTCYVMVTPCTVFAWIGASCPEALQAEMAALAPKVLRYAYRSESSMGASDAGSIVTVHQGKEPKEFFDQLMLMLPKYEVGVVPQWDDFFGPTGPVFQPDILRRLSRLREQHAPASLKQQLTTLLRRRQPDSDGSARSSSRCDSTKDASNTNGSRRRSVVGVATFEMYTWSTREGIDMFDSDDLDQEEVHIVVRTETEKEPCSIFVWIGQKVDVPSGFADVYEWGESIGNEFAAWKGLEASRPNKCVVLANEEPDSFWDCFPDG